MAQKAWGPQFRQTLFRCTMSQSALSASLSQQPRTAPHGLPLLSLLQLWMQTREKQGAPHMVVQTNQPIHEHLLHPQTGPHSSRPLPHLQLQWLQRVEARVTRHDCSPTCCPCPELCLHSLAGTRKLEVTDLLWKSVN
ncbi:uncharacterized protein LOC144102509 [Amblyomma americanum]